MSKLPNVYLAILIFCLFLLDIPYFIYSCASSQWHSVLERYKSSNECNFIASSKSYILGHDISQDMSLCRK